MVLQWGLAPIVMASPYSSLRSAASSFVDAVLSTKGVVLAGVIAAGTLSHWTFFTEPTVASVEEPVPVKQVQTTIHYEVHTFDQRWPSMAFVYPPQMQSKPVVEKPVVVEKSAHTERVVKPKRNLCERHGMRKVHIGKRWRCKRAI